MAKSIMIQGTMSNVGKSIISAGLCRIFKQDGFKTAPFKSQNMALNSFVTARGEEMGRAQAVQAEAAGIQPDARMNPILLKPTTDTGSQVIVGGRSIGNMAASEYFRKKRELIPYVMEAYNSLAAEYDVIVIEGAGSPAEINLREGDIVNMGLSMMVKAPVLLAGDIDRGGVFAQLYGTAALLRDEEKPYLKGVIVNKFRGSRKILEPGVKILEDLCKVPVIGVVPYMRIGIDDEDSLSERLENNMLPGLVDIAVIKLPRISNFTDFSAFEGYRNVSLRYVDDVSRLMDPDIIFIPGTKSTMEDLRWIRQKGFDSAVKKAASKGTVIFGICGGYQILGKSISDPERAEAGKCGALKEEGLGLIDMDTVFMADKIQTQSKGRIGKVEGVLFGLSGMEYEGYEIHMGRSKEEKNIIESNGCIYGSYIHGLFDKAGIGDAVVGALLERKGIDRNAAGSFDLNKYKEEQYDILADTLRCSLDMEKIYRIMEAGV